MRSQLGMPGWTTVGLDLLRMLPPARCPTTFTVKGAFLRPVPQFSTYSRCHFLLSFTFRLSPASAASHRLGNTLQRG